jgi:hypothetical protein
MVDEGSCTWVDVPGTNPTVRLEIQNGQPLQILRAFVADVNAYVEHVRDADTACWTATNSVDTSNHLSGTAVDINWDSHPFRVADAGWSTEQIATIREIQDFYEGTIFWGNDWTDPKDAMHFQLASLANGGNIDTYNNPQTQDFIDRKIRSDGFSKFRRSDDVVLSVKDRHALDIIGEGRRRGISERGIKIALATALVESNITIYANERVPESMTIAHEAVGSDAYSVGIFQQQVRNTGNGWWWGDAATCMDPSKSAGLFYDRLAKLDYNGPNSPGSYAQQVQASAYPDRYDQRFGEATDLYNRLANSGDDELSAEAERMIAEMHQELFKTFTSRSMYRDSNDPLDTIAGFGLWTNGSSHEERVETAAMLGAPDAIAIVARLAAGQGPGASEPDNVRHAVAFLNLLEATRPEVLKQYIADAKGH